MPALSVRAGVLFGQSIEMVAQPLDPEVKTFVDEQDKLIAIALRIVESRAVAEEVVQESWLRWQRHGYAAEDAA
ncbi:MAG: hypothetical protein AAF681_12200, partial [Pseudomonadota bacterium]